MVGTLLAGCLFDSGKNDRYLLLIDLQCRCGILLAIIVGVLVWKI